MTFPTTEDALFGGALRLIQPRSGHRAGTDAALLAAACPLEAATVVDLGAGVGTVGLRVAQAGGAARCVVLVDNDPAILGLARRNVEANGLAGRCHVVAADVLSRGFAKDEPLAGLRADVVLTNPPFFDGRSGRASPVPLKAAAHVMPGGLDGWIRAALRVMAPRGEIVIIHRADALAALLTALDRRFGRLQILPVQPTATAPAVRILVRARRGARTPLRILPPLVLHGADGAFTAEADAIHRGAASIPWA